ncbi:MAG: nuclear transport factor 2 family protein [Chloroflexi bacterium]|nr:nuclear transport factor 2 family protein [Chloroflexota bacterium]
MNEHPNVAAVWRAFEAWNAGQIEALKGTFSEDAVLRFAGNNRMSGTYRGADEVVDALLRANQGGGPRADVKAVLASDDHVMVFFRATGERGGKSLDVVLAEAMKFDADGKMTEVWFLANDQAAYDEYWSSSPG